MAIWGMGRVLAEPKESEVGAKPSRVSVARPVLPLHIDPRIEPSLPMHLSEWAVARGPASIPDEVQFDPELVQAAPPQFLTDHAACTLFRSSTYLVSQDGTVEAVHHFLYRLNNRSAVEGDGEWPIEYDPAYERFSLNEARVHGAGGAVRELRPDDVHVRDSNTDYQVYDQYKQAVLSFPGLETGDVVEIVFTIAGRDPSQEGMFTVRYPFNDPVQTPLVHGELVVQTPIDLPLVHATFGGGVRVAESTDGGTRTCRFSVGPVTPPADEVESTLAEEYEVGAACSTFDSWDSVAEFRRRQSAACGGCPPDVSQKVAELIRDCPTDEAKAQAICVWVRDSIRYRSHRCGPYAALPHPPADVYRACHGDCWDKSQLIHVMLQEAGIGSEFVFVNTEGAGRMDHRVPSPSADHVFLSVLAGEGRHWVDATATFNPWDQMRRDCYGREAYFLTDSTYRLETLPEMPAEAFKIENRTTVDIAVDGSARWRSRRTWHGLAAGETREAWMANTAAERRREIAADYRSYYPGVRVTRLELDRELLAASDKPLEVDFELDVPELFSGEGRRFSTLYEPQLWSYLLSVSEDEERLTPVRFTTPIELTHSIELVAPPGEEFDYLPEPRHIESRWATVDLEVSPSGLTRAMVTWKMRLHDPRIDPDDMEEYGLFHDAAYAVSGVSIGLRPQEPAVPPDARDEISKP
jgi:transglutaminase-like putative cysteine protease